MSWNQIKEHCIYGIGTVIMLAASAALYLNGLMELNFFLGMLLCLFDLFVPIKSFYEQEARLTVMSVCMDRIESLFAEKKLDDSGTQTLADKNAPEIEYRTKATFSRRSVSFAGARPCSSSHTGSTPLSARTTSWS